MEVTIKRLVRRPLTEVFDYIADTRNDADWAPLVEGVEQVAGDGPGVGSRYRFQQQLRGKVFPWESEMTAFQRPALIQWEGQVLGKPIKSTMMFAPHDRGTLVKQTNDAPYGRNAFEKFIVKGVVKRTLRKQLRNVERNLRARDLLP